MRMAGTQPFVAPEEKRALAQCPWVNSASCAWRAQVDQGDPDGQGDFQLTGCSPQRLGQQRSPPPLTPPSVFQCDSD